MMGWLLRVAVSAAAVSVVAFLVLTAFLLLWSSSLAAASRCRLVFAAVSLCSASISARSGRFLFRAQFHVGQRAGLGDDPRHAPAFLQRGERAVYL